MASSLHQTNRASSEITPNSPVALAQNGNSAQIVPHRPSPAKSAQSPRSPFRRVSDGRISKVAKQALLDNLELELNERTRKLRAQYTQQSHALKQRIEMRINRIPKKLWTMTMAELLAQAEARELASVGGAKGFLNDVRRLSHGEGEKARDERIAVQKKRVQKKSGGARQMVPPHAPQSPHNPLGLSSKSNLPPLSSSPARSSSPQRPTPQRAASPVKQAPKPSRARKAAPNSSRPASRATARSSTETAGTTMSTATGMRGTKSSQARAKAVAAAAAVTAADSEKNKGLKRGGGTNNTGSNGSLKENRVAGVKKDATSKAGSASRVLRSRK